jgi:hypothetical protein
MQHEVGNQQGGGMGGDTCVLGPASGHRQQWPDVSSASHRSGLPADTLSCRADRTWEAGRRMTGAMNNLHSLGRSKAWTGGIHHPVRPTRR